MTDARPIGARLEGWSPPVPPQPDPMVGQWCRLEPLRGAHVPDLFAAFSRDDGAMWDYMPNGPYDTEADLARFVEEAERSRDPLFFAVLVDGRALGFATYLRIDPPNGVIEVGFITLSPALQRTTAATEVMFLMMRHAFALGYRRYEWKCNALNAPSIRAALRLGFTHEGTFRQAAVVKGRNRDTAWFSILDSEWPKARAAFETWLAPENFDAQGRQRQRLEDLRE